jgi:phosphate transport system permease protein
MCLKYACVAAAYLIVVLLGGMVGFILVKGLPNLTANFVFGQSSNANPTLKSAFITTILTVIATMGIALPVGIGGAIYLNEYAARGGRVLKIVHLFTDTLSGIPSIVFGLFGMVFFVKIFGGRCILAGALTMSLIILPTVIRTTEEALREVPVGMREASLALGASKARTIFKIVLPSAIGGIVTSAILGIGRIVGESAALIYTAGATFPVPSGYLDTGATFAVMMYTLSSAGKTDVFGQTSMGKTYATAAVLLVFVGSINWLVSLIKKRKA